MSMMQSAVLMTSRLCSITSTVLPVATSRCSTPQELADVLEVQAGGGLVEDVERVAGGALVQLGASLIRWASPPDRVGAGWPSLM